MATNKTTTKKKIKISKILPIVKRASTSTNKEENSFPVEHYSYSSFVKFSTNPLMFKINYVNGDIIDTTSSASAVLGKAVHKALEAYLQPVDEADAVKYGHDTGAEYLNNYSDGFINYTSTIPNRQNMNEKYAFAYFEYIKAFKQDNVGEILLVEKQLKHKIEIEGKILPVPLKGFPDFVYRDKQGRIRIDDHKMTGKFSDEDSIDGAKLLQAAFLYFLVYAELGEAPYDMTFRECKFSKNKDNSSQVREYTIVYSEVPDIFELFYRMYDDVTNGLLGKQVFLPNLNAMFDKEVSILAYIHRLDVDEERAKALKKAKVDNITDFLKKKIEKDGSMKKFLETVSQKFVSANTLNYKDMTPQEKIKMKMAEHGIGLEFDSVQKGYSVDLYKYEPSIGLKMSKIGAFVKDIEQVMEVSGIRVLAPIPNSGLVGFEVPAKERTFPSHNPKNDGFNIAVGVDIYGNDKRIDIREAPHMLVAGATGSGKSVFLSSTIKQLQKIKNAELYLFDPKMVELVDFADKVAVYQSDNFEIQMKIHDLVNEMNRRYAAMQKAKVKNIKDMTGMKYIFVVIDEYGDLVASNSSKESTVKNDILLLAQKARACGIHLIVTTQRPSIKIIDGDIKANFPTRIAFRTSTSIDSDVILDQAGAQTLLGKGDMLLKTADDVVRLQGFNL